jgi:DNA-binding CsgD family transcriptional regulator
MTHLDDPIAILESAYRIDVRHRSEWLESILESLYEHSRIPGLRGAGASFLELDAGEGPRFHETVVAEGTDFDADFYLNMLDAQPIEQAVSRIRADGTSCGTLGQRLGLSKEMMEGAEPSPLGFADILGISAYDPEGWALVFALPAEHLIEATDAFQDSLQRVAIHIAAAFRLKRRLGGPVLDEADAIFDANGKLEYLAPEEESRREAAADSVERVREVRSSYRGELGTKGLEIWQGLLEGRWSLAEVFDTDGRQFFVLRKNDPQVAGPNALTMRERQIATYAAVADTNQIIAYELGISPSTVSTLLGRAMKKLGIDNRADLIRLVRGLAPASESTEPSQPD